MSRIRYGIKCYPIQSNPTPSATNYPGRLRPPVYCSALICHSAPFCRLARSIVPGRLRRFLRAQLANCVGQKTALNIFMKYPISGRVFPQYRISQTNIDILVEDPLRTILIKACGKSIVTIDFPHFPLSTWLFLVTDEDPVFYQIVWLPSQHLDVNGNLT